LVFAADDVWWCPFRRLQPAKRTPPNIIRSKPQHTTKREQDNRCDNPSTQSQAPEDGHINVRNMLSK
jgi:hypothetical protein